MFLHQVNLKGYSLLFDVYLPKSDEKRKIMPSIIGRGNIRSSPLDLTHMVHVSLMPKLINLHVNICICLQLICLYTTIVILGLKRWCTADKKDPVLWKLNGLLQSSQKGSFVKKTACPRVLDILLHSRFLSLIFFLKWFSCPYLCAIFRYQDHVFKDSIHKSLAVRWNWTWQRVHGLCWEIRHIWIHH